MGGIGGALISAGINLADDALFATLDVAGSYKSLGEAGLEFGKKAACALVNVRAWMHGRAVIPKELRPATRAFRRFCREDGGW
jgi:hypothetical protein